MPKKTKGDQEDIESSGPSHPVEQEVVYHIHCKRCGAVQVIDLEEFKKEQPYKYHCINCNHDTFPWAINSLIFDVAAAFGGHAGESVADDILEKCKKFNKPSNITYPKVGDFLEYCCREAEGTMNPKKLAQIRALLSNNMGYEMRIKLLEIQLVLHTDEDELAEAPPWFYEA